LEILGHEISKKICIKMKNKQTKLLNMQKNFVCHELSLNSNLTYPLQWPTHWRLTKFTWNPICMYIQYIVASTVFFFFEISQFKVIHYIMFIDYSLFFWEHWWIEANTQLVSCLTNYLKFNANAWPILNNIMYDNSFVYFMSFKCLYGSHSYKNVTRK